MRDVELYQQILGLDEPWSVKSVELNIDEGRVDIHVDHPDLPAPPLEACRCESHGLGIACRQSSQNMVASGPIALSQPVRS